MTLNIKDIGQLEEEIMKKHCENSTVMLLDTGGLIDIVHATRNYSFNGNGKTEKNPNYGKVTSFLKYLSEKFPVLITPKTYQEIQNHGQTRLNGHTIELSPKVVDFALMTMTDSVKFIEGLTGRLPLDDARYDAYWASKEGCRNNPKKDTEGCSDTDREILSIAAYLSNCGENKSKSKILDSVLVLSPDAHIIQGTKFLKRGFEGRYSNLIPISTRQ